MKSFHARLLRRFILPAGVLLLSVSLPAAEWTLADYGCLISVPDTDDWHAVDAPEMPDSVLILEDSTNSRSVVLNVTEIERGNKTVLDRYAERMVEAMKEAGGRDVVKRETTLSGLRAWEVSGAKDVDGEAVAAATRVCVFRRYMYVLTVSSSLGPIADDEQLQRAVEGFSIPIAEALKEAEAAREAEDSSGADGRFDITEYWYHVAALLGAIFLGLWLKTRKKTDW